MRTLDREATIQQILERRVSAIVRTDDQAAARSAMQAAVAGGFRMVEFTLTTPGALDLIREFTADADLLVGAGTVLTAKSAKEAVRVGARFLVSPVCDPEVIACARELGAVSIPGTFTPTEMWRAHCNGADFVKLFPSPGNVVDFITAIRGPLPQLRIFPTAGVTIDNFVEILKAGAAGVGFVRPLFDPVLISQGRFDEIERRAKTIISRLPD